MDRRQPTTESDKNIFERNRKSLLRFGSAVAIGVSALTLSACGPSADAQPGPKPAVTQSVEVTPSATPEATATTNPAETAETPAEKEFDAFVETLSPVQKTWYETYTPDKMAATSIEELKTAFAIPLAEVSVDGTTIDPKLYAASTAIRSMAFSNAGCTNADLGSYDYFDASAQNVAGEITSKYLPLAYKFYGSDYQPPAELNGGGFSEILSNWASFHYDEQDKKIDLPDYKAFVSTTGDAHFDEYGSLVFTLHMTDNINDKMTEVKRSYGDASAPIDLKVEWSINADPSTQDPSILAVAGLKSHTTH